MRALLTARVSALLFSAMTLIMWDAVHDVASGQLTGGSLAAFVFTAGIVAGAFQALTEVYGELLRASGAAGRLSELLAESPEIAAPAHPVALPSPARGALASEHVPFHYPDRPAIAAAHHFSLADRNEVGEGQRWVGSVQ